MSVEDGIKLIHDVYAKILGKEYKKSRVQILISNSKGIKVAPKNKDWCKIEHTIKREFHLL